MSNAPRTRMNIRMKDELADRLIKAAQEEELPLSVFLQTDALGHATLRTARLAPWTQQEPTGEAATRR